MSLSKSLFSIVSVLILALFLRCILLVYGLWQDSNSEVKYTDVDYRVFTDAARHMSNMRSPYDRETYRYTPLLAAMLLPNIFWFESFGKLLFCAFDILTGVMIYLYLTEVEKLECNYSAKLTCLWLFNPLTLAISTRGSAESIMSFLLITLIYFIAKDQAFLGGVIYALAILYKIYPVIYSLPIFLYFQKSRESKGFVSRLFIPTRPTIVFASASAVVLLRLLYLMYQLYDYKAIYETYLYHIYRKDTKHNFSVFFYMYYLLGSNQGSSEKELTVVKMVPFLLQSLAVTSLSFKFYKDIPFCCFVTTFAFVALNKVCTSQYFIWYLTYLPLIAPKLEMPVGLAVPLALMWIVTQLLWLLPAYLLEFQGVNTFEFIWAASVLFFLANNYILVKIVRSYSLKMNKIKAT